MEALVRRPWLLPVAWAVSKGYRCDPILISMELGIPARLARTLTYYAERYGICNGNISLCIVRRGRVFYAKINNLILYARVKGRRVSSGVFSPTGVYLGWRKKVWDEALRVLGEC